jgi:hypothetical protein
LAFTRFLLDLTDHDWLTMSKKITNVFRRMKFGGDRSKTPDPREDAPSQTRLASPPLEKPSSNPDGKRVVDAAARKGHDGGEEEKAAGGKESEKNLKQPVSADADLNLNESECTTVMIIW